MRYRYVSGRVVGTVDGADGGARRGTCTGGGGGGGRERQERGGRCRAQAETGPVGPGLRRRLVRLGPGLRHAGRIRDGQRHRDRRRAGVRAPGPLPPSGDARAHGHDGDQERAGAAPVPGDGREARAVPGGRAVPGRGAQTVPGGRAQAVPGGRRTAVPGARGPAVPGAGAAAVRRARRQARRRPGASSVSRRRAPPAVVRPRRTVAVALPQAAVLRPRPVVNATHVGRITRVATERRSFPNDFQPHIFIVVFPPL